MHSASVNLIPATSCHGRLQFVTRTVGIVKTFGFVWDVAAVHSQLVHDIALAVMVVTDKDGSFERRF